MATRHGRRNTGYRLIAMVAIAAMAALSAPRMAPAADPPQAAQTPQEPQTPQSPQAQQGWRVECDSTAKALDCRLVAEAFNPQNHQLLAAVVIRVPAETKKPVMLIRLPLGILVSSPVAIQIEHHAQVEHQPGFSFAIQTCTAAGCFVGTPLADDLLAAMRTGKQMDVTYQSTEKQNVSVPLPLSGFAVAYDKIK